MTFLQRFLKQGYTAALVAPRRTNPTRIFCHTLMDPGQRQALLHKVQRLRAESYLARGIITPSELNSEQGYPSRFDEISWHLLALKGDSLVGVMEFRLYDATYSIDDLKIIGSLQRVPSKERYMSAVKEFICFSLASESVFGEVSGWVAAARGCSSIVGVFVALCSWSFYRLHGNANVIAMTRIDGGAAAITSKMGGAPLCYAGNELPAYYDPYYRSHLKLQRFDSRHVSAAFQNDIRAIDPYLSDIPVYAQPGLVHPQLVSPFPASSSSTD